MLFPFPSGINRLNSINVLPISIPIFVDNFIITLTFGNRPIIWMDLDIKMNPRRSGDIGQIRPQMAEVKLNIMVLCLYQNSF